MLERIQGRLQRTKEESRRHQVARAAHPRGSQASWLLSLVSFLGLSRLSCKLCGIIEREASQAMGSQGLVLAYAASRHCYLLLSVWRLLRHSPLCRCFSVSLYTSDSEHCSRLQSISDPLFLLSDPGLPPRYITRVHACLRVSCACPRD